MRKTAIVALCALVLGVSAPVMPQAHAATVLDTILAQAVSQNPTAARAQDLIRIKQDLDQGNHGDLLGMLAQAAADKAGRGDIAAAAASIASSGDMGQTVQAVVSQAVQEKVADKLGPYQDGLSVLMTLFKNSNLNPQSAQDNTSLAAAPQHYSKVLQMTATAYAPGWQDNGRWNNITYLGGPIRKGVVAVDPKVIPLGTRLWVEGYGEAVAEDEGSAIIGNRVDLAFNTRTEALDYGMKQVKVYILN